ncbi:MAG: pyridoxal 5'-phosphate synthase glutaminase subunit PdxT [Candidatus Izemoplasmatales bacterium]|jgi:5'-phosphate synthase pdxT subunit|nr:pyridoxal 5'-phosphate synthase glutaminase subunit PdxT [Candidatus Izemoplasmatales bacterium]MDD3865169.1 pyridoxal 5'-phosphate synthase glutaminase subunit PdxT [Candidatus Izemoplasmatales bacterium]
MPIGILAIQGAFREHEMTLDRLHVKHFQIRQAKDLDQPMEGLILPGGESTTMVKLLTDLKLFEPLLSLITSGLPVFGTCAGLLLLAKQISGTDKLGFQTMSIRAKRNAYGRQLGSFACEGHFADLGIIPMVFIRAPYIDSIFGKTEILAIVNDHIVAARENQQLVTAFHPELTNDDSVHKYFISMCQKNKKS